MTDDFLSSLPRLRGGWRVNTVLQRAECRGDGDGVKTAPSAAGPARQVADDPAPAKVRATKLREGEKK